MEITPGSPVLYGILSILFSFLLFALPRHYSFFSHCSIQLPLLNDSVSFIFFSRLFYLFLEYCISIIAMCHTFRYLFFNNFPLTMCPTKDHDFSII